PGQRPTGPPSTMRTGVPAGAPAGWLCCPYSQYPRRPAYPGPHYLHHVEVAVRIRRVAWLCSAPGEYTLLGGRRLFRLEPPGESFAFDIEGGYERGQPFRHPPDPLAYDQHDRGNDE